jgi:hypothetical protein
MNALNRLSVVTMLSLTVGGGVVHAQRREQTPTAAPIIVEFKTAVRFGEQTVPPRRYRISLSGESLALVDSDTMLQVAVLPAQVVPSPVASSVAVADITARGGIVTIELRYLDKSYSAKGAIAAAGPKNAILVELNGKQEAVPDTEPAASESDRSNIDRALTRLLPDLDYCIDRAHRGRWTGDDPRLERCICPLINKWHFAKISTRLRTDRPLVSGRFGFSFAVTPEGKVEKCSAWSGAAPPPEAPPAPAEPAPAAPGPVPGAGASPNAPGTTPPPAAAPAAPSGAAGAGSGTAKP